MNPNPRHASPQRKVPADGAPTDAAGGPPPPAADSFESQFQKLKTRLHREVLESLDLSKLGTLDNGQLRRHLESMTQRLFRSRQEMLSRLDEERLIDELIAEKRQLAADLLEGGAEKLLTEMTNAELIRFVSLDVARAGV